MRYFYLTFILLFTIDLFSQDKDIITVIEKVDAISATPHRIISIDEIYSEKTRYSEQSHEEFKITTFYQEIEEEEPLYYLAFSVNRDFNPLDPTPPASEIYDDKIIQSLVLSAEEVTELKDVVERVWELSKNKSQMEFEGFFDNLIGGYALTKYPENWPRKDLSGRWEFQCYIGDPDIGHISFVEPNSFIDASLEYIFFTIGLDELKKIRKHLKSF